MKLGQKDNGGEHSVEKDEGTYIVRGELELEPVENWFFRD